MIKNWKKYWKIVAAAVFLTVAGLCYGFAGGQDETIILSEDGGTVLENSGERSVKECFSGLTGEMREAAGDDGSIGGAEISDSPGINESEHQEADPPKCFVHICGEVEKPGVYELAEGSRVFQAVEAAGGFTAEASQSSMNLAETIADGMQIVILSKEEAEAVQAAEEESAAGLVNINQASKEQLMALPGIGESRAEDIIRYREESGGFQRIEDIMKVSGIKDAAFQKIKDSIAV